MIARWVDAAVLSLDKGNFASFCAELMRSRWYGKIDYQSLMVGQFKDYDGRHLMRSMCLCIMASRLTASVSPATASQMGFPPVFPMVNRCEETIIK